MNKRNRRKRFFKRTIAAIQTGYNVLYSDEGPEVERSVFESFTIANLPY